MCVDNLLGDELIKLNLTTEDRVKDMISHDIKVSTSKYYYEQRMLRNNILATVPINRYGVRVYYGKRLLDFKASLDKTKCLICANDTDKFVSFSACVSDNTFDSKLLTESTLISFIRENSTFKLSWLLNLIQLPDTYYVKYHIEEHNIKGRMCCNCLHYYIANKFYPNHVNKKSSLDNRTSGRRL